MDMEKIYRKALALDFLTADEALVLYESGPLDELMSLAWELRQKHVPGRTVTWQIDRNVNITNVCISGCKFCNFHCKPHDTQRAFVTSREEYREKIAQTLALGGDQLLLQGGLHPQLGIDFYEELFRDLKRMFPRIRLHALGAPEVAHIARISGLTTLETLRRLMAAGLDSLPGAGAEILDPDVRRAISPAKPSVASWLAVMHEAHTLGLATSATMMYGHVEQPRQRVDHLLAIRDLQARCPEGKPGFLAFIPWIFRSTGTRLEAEGISTDFSPLEYIRIIAASNRNLRELVAQGAFREDLFFRLDVIPLFVPPLRERQGDIRLLVAHFLQSFSRERGCTYRVATELMHAFEAYPWPGNVRELKNFVEYGVGFCEHGVLTLDLMDSRFKTASSPPVKTEKGMPSPPPGPARDTAEYDRIMQLLGRYGQHTEGKKRTASELGISLATLYRRMGQLGITARKHAR